MDKHIAMRGLIEVLLDPSAREDEHHDAAMDLRMYPEEEAEHALIQIGSNPEANDVIQEACGESLGEIWVVRNKFNKDGYLKLTPLAQLEALSAIAPQKPEWLDEYDLPTLKKKIFGKRNVTSQEVKETMLPSLLNPAAKLEDRLAAADLLSEYPNDPDIERSLYEIGCDKKQKRNLQAACGAALACIWVAQGQLNKERYHNLAPWAYRAAKEAAYSLKPEWQKQL